MLYLFLVVPIPSSCLMEMKLLKYKPMCAMYIMVQYKLKYISASDVPHVYHAIDGEPLLVITHHVPLLNGDVLDLLWTLLKIKAT